MRKGLAYSLVTSAVLGSFLAGTVRAELVGWWKFDELSGAVARDWSGRGNAGTVLGNPRWVAGQVGGALKLDGTDDYVNLPIGSLMSSLSSCTVALWVNYPTAGSAWQCILDFGSGTSNYIYLCPRDASGVLHVAITAGTGTWTNVSATASLPTGWHHVALVIDGRAKTLQVLVDGEVFMEGSTLYTLSDLGVTNQNGLGRSQFTDDGFYNGSLDDVRIYNRALSEAEVRYLAGDR